MLNSHEHKFWVRDQFSSILILILFLVGNAILQVRFNYLNHYLNSKFVAQKEVIMECKQEENIRSWIADLQKMNPTIKVPEYKVSFTKGECNE